MEKVSYEGPAFILAIEGRTKKGSYNKTQRARNKEKLEEYIDEQKGKTGAMGRRREKAEELIRIIDSLPESKIVISKKKVASTRKVVPKKPDDAGPKKTVKSDVGEPSKTNKPAIIVGDSGDDKITEIYNISNKSFLSTKDLKIEDLSRLQADYTAVLKQIKSLKDAKVVYDYELKRKDSTLKDLLINIVLSIEDDWEDRINNLIEISAQAHLKGSRHFNGTDYFEGLWKVAFALGFDVYDGKKKVKSFDKILRFSNVNIGRLDRALFSKDDAGLPPNNFLNEPLRAGGAEGKEQGISDLTFELGKAITTEQLSPPCESGCVVKVDTNSDNITYICSSKNFQKEKSIKSYDTAFLSDVINKYKEKFSSADVSRRFGILVFAKDSDLVEEKYKRSDLTYIKQSFGDVLGFFKHLMPWIRRKRDEVWLTLKTSGIDSPTKEDIEKYVNDYFKPKAIDLPKLQMYLHQELIAHGVQNRIENDKQRYLCVGVLPRGGKSYICGGIISNMLKKRGSKPLVVLHVTSAVTETRSQFEKLITKTADFQNPSNPVEFVEIKKSITKLKPKKSYFLFVSRELLGLSTEKKRVASGTHAQVKKRALLDQLKAKSIKVDICFFDEVHLGGGTETSQDLIDEFAEVAPVVLLTATYAKPVNHFLKEGEERAKNLFIWSLEDIYQARRLGEYTSFDAIEQKGFVHRFGLEQIKEFLNKRLAPGKTENEVLHNIASYYQLFPDLYFLSATYNDKAIESFEKQKCYDKTAGFSMGSIFALKKNHNELVGLDKFDNLQAVQTFLHFLTPTGLPLKGVYESIPESMDPFGNIKGVEKKRMTVFGRILHVSENAVAPLRKSRIRDGKPYSVLMFMPLGSQTDAELANREVCEAWSDLILQNPWWRDRFVVAIVTGKPKAKKAKAKPATTAGGGGDTGDIELDLTSEQDDDDDEDDEFSIRLVGGGSTKECIAGETYCDLSQGSDLKEQLEKLEREAACPLDGSMPKGLIILAGQRLSMGISLPCVDVVCLFNEEVSVDNITQKLYRAVTESTGKTIGFIVDMNPRRSVKAVYTYSQLNAQFTGDSDADPVANTTNLYQWDSDALTFGKMPLDPASWNELIKKNLGLDKIPEEIALEKGKRQYQQEMLEKLMLLLKTDPKSLLPLAPFFGYEPDDSEENPDDPHKGHGKGVKRPKKEKKGEKAKVEKTKMEPIDFLIANLPRATTNLIDILQFTSNESFESTLREFLSNGDYTKIVLESLILRGDIIIPKDDEDGTESSERIRAFLKESGRRAPLVELFRKVGLEKFKNLFEGRELQMKAQTRKNRRVTDKESPGYHSRNSVLEYIDKHMTINEKLKKDFGEVFTPLSLVQKMLFGATEDGGIYGYDEKEHIFKEPVGKQIGGLPPHVWKDPELKWLDPANGMGNFPIMVFYKLDFELEKLGRRKLKSGQTVDFKNINARREHIIKNMLFMMEINKKNVKVSREKIFKPLAPSVEPNIWDVSEFGQKGSLAVKKEDFEKHDWPSKFDIVIGNPPFQAFQEAEGARGGGDELYMKFVKWCLGNINESSSEEAEEDDNEENNEGKNEEDENMNSENEESVKAVLKNDGYLVFVHPPSWRKPEFNEGRKKSKNSGMFNLMAHSNQIIYLEIHDMSDGNKIFHAGTRFDFYVLQKKMSSETTLVKDMMGNFETMDLKDFEFLPNFNIKNVQKLMPTSDTQKCLLGSFDNEKKKYKTKPCVLFERSAYGGDKKWVSTTETSDFKYPLIHSTSKDGPKIYYSNTNKNGMFGIPKVIFGDSTTSVSEPIIDLAGKYGMTQHAIGLVVDDLKDAESLTKFLKSNFFRNVITACSWSTFGIDWRLFTYFKKKFWKVKYPVSEPIIVNPEKAKGGGTRTFFDKTRKHRRV